MKKDAKLIRDINDTKLEQMLGVDNADGILWGYEPRNFNQGDIVVCTDSQFNYPSNEKIVAGEKYKVRM